jgi:hypothetical protein
LKPRTAVRRLRNLEQELSIGVRVAERNDHPLVAVHLDRQA